MAEMITSSLCSQDTSILPLESRSLYLILTFLSLKIHNSSLVWVVNTLIFDIGGTFFVEKNSICGVFRAIYFYYLSFQVDEGKSYNPYFPGGVISMPQQLFDEGIEYKVIYSLFKLDIKFSDCEDISNDGRKITNIFLSFFRVYRNVRKFNRFFVREIRT